MALHGHNSLTEAIQSDGHTARHQPSGKTIAEPRRGRNISARGNAPGPEPINTIASPVRAAHQNALEQFSFLCIVERNTSLLIRLFAPRGPRVVATGGARLSSAERNPWKTFHTSTSPRQGRRDGRFRVTRESRFRCPFGAGIYWSFLPTGCAPARFASPALHPWLNSRAPSGPSSGAVNATLSLWLLWPFSDGKPASRITKPVSAAIRPPAKVVLDRSGALPDRSRAPHDRSRATNNRSRTPHDQS